jgi:hypothetical protein
MSGDDLLRQAQERAESWTIPEEWGSYRIQLAEEEGFKGRWRGETADELNGGRRIFLFWDEDGEECFSRSYASLSREIDRVAPAIGDNIGVWRGRDYTAANGTGFSFGVESESNPAPLPGSPVTVAVRADDDDDIPF